MVRLRRIGDHPSIFSRESCPAYMLCCTDISQLSDVMGAFSTDLTSLAGWFMSTSARKRGHEASRDRRTRKKGSRRLLAGD
jgi:hypothetical protein